MRTTISWRKIFEDFKTRHPNMSKTIYHWYPSGDLELTIKLNDGTILIYDYISKKSAVVPKEPEPEERKEIMDEQEWREEFSEKLFDILYGVGMTQKELAEAIGVDERTIRTYKHGDRTPSAYVVYKMANVLGCSVSELIDFEE